jgi:hypothetical protein
VSDDEPTASRQTRVTVNLTAKSLARVEHLAAKYDDTKTDTINRAIALYDYLDGLSDAGGVFTVNAAGELERLVLTR